MTSISKDNIAKLVRSHTINVLRECATQTHTDWEKYVAKSEKQATQGINLLLQKQREDIREKHTHRLPYIPKELEVNNGQGLMFKAVCADCEQEFTYVRPPIQLNKSEGEQQ